MTRPASIAAGLAFAASASLVVAGCGDTGADAGTGDPAGSPTPGSRQEVTDDVVLRLVQKPAGTTLSASNESGRPVFVLLPMGDPVRQDTSDGIRLTYLRPDSGSTGDEPVLHEAAVLPAGGTRRVDASNLGTWTSEIRLCLEVVPTEDRAAPGGDGTVEVDGGDSGPKPVVACSEPARIG